MSEEKKEPIVDLTPSVEENKPIKKETLSDLKGATPEQLSSQAEELRKGLGITVPGEQPPKDEEPKDKSLKEDGDKAKVSPDIKALQKEMADMKAENDRLKKTFEDRISKKTAREKELQEELESLKQADKITDDDVVAEHNRLSKEMVTLRKKIRNAELDDEDGLDDLYLSEERLRSQIRAVEREGRRIKQEAKTTAISKAAQLNKDKFNASWGKAAKKFPEVLNKEGRFDKDSSLAQETFRLLGQNAKKPIFLTSAKSINPEYDHANGAYMAMVEAKLNLMAKGTEQKTTSEIEKLKRDNIKLNANNQPLSESHAEGGLKTIPSTIEALRTKATRKDATQEDLDVYTRAALKEANAKAGVKI